MHHSAWISSGISLVFTRLSQSTGQVVYALLTRSPVYYFNELKIPLDLHVLSTPPAFTLSQDQTLQNKVIKLLQVVILI